MDTTFQVYKRLDIFDRAEISEARMKYEWGKGYRDYRTKERKFWTHLNELLQLLAIGFKPDVTRKQLNRFLALNLPFDLVKNYFKF